MAESAKNETQERHMVLRKLIRGEEAGTQEELCEALMKKGFEVTQSTVSRDLRKIGAIKVNNAEGEIVYRLPEDHSRSIAPINNELTGLLIDVEANATLIVLHTAPGSASLVASHLDSIRQSLGILGTIAGDDAIFVVPVSEKKIPGIIKKIKDELI